MHGVALVPGTILFQFDPRRIVLFVFFSRIVSMFALGAFERDDETILFLCHFVSQVPGCRIRLAFASSRITRILRLDIN